MTEGRDRPPGERPAGRHEGIEAVGLAVHGAGGQGHLLTSPSGPRIKTTVSEVSHIIL